MYNLKHLQKKSTIFIIIIKKFKNNLIVKISYIEFNLLRLLFSFDWFQVKNFSHK